MDNHAGLIVEDGQRKVLICNSKFCDIFGIPVKPESLIGTDCSDSAGLVKHLFVDEEKFVNDIYIILDKREPVIGEILNMKSGVNLRRDYLPIFSGDKYIGHTWQYYLLDSEKKWFKKWFRIK